MKDNQYEGYYDGNGNPIPPEEMRRSFENSAKLERDSKIEIITKSDRTKLLIGGMDVSDFTAGFFYEHEAGCTPHLYVNFTTPNIVLDVDEAHVSIALPEEETD